MKKEGRIARDLRTVQEISRDPRSILPRVRGWLVELWALRGGGFYGLGYIVAFVALEIATLTGDFGSSASVSGFFEAQILQYLARVSVQSMINTVLALLWPIYLLRWWGWYGIAMLVIGIIYHLLFMFGLRHERRALAAQGLIHAESRFPPSFTLVTAVLLLVIGTVVIVSMAFGVGPFS